MAYIYKIINDINNNVYIGETIRPLEKRWQQHKQKANDSTICGHLQLAMRKYGIEHFQISIIETCPNEKRFEREKYWIEQYNSYYDGYNSTLGGEGLNQYKYEEIYDLWLDGNDITTICEKIGCCDTTVQSALQSFGITIADHTTRRCGKPVEQYTKDGRFVAKYDSANAAGRALGLVNGGNIIKCCLGEIKTSKGFIWKYADDNISIEDLTQSKKKNTTGKIVQQFSIDDNFIAEYDSCEEAARTIGKTNGSVISRCARGVSKTAYGYKWKYKDI